MTPPLTQAQAEGLKELLAKATPGPWKHFKAEGLSTADGKSNGRIDSIMAGPGTHHNEVVHWKGFDASHFPKSKRKSNAALIVAAVNSLPALLAERDAMVEALMAAKQFIVNGVECGFIRMPEYQDDPAHNTLPLIESVLARALLGAKP